MGLIKNYAPVQKNPKSDYRLCKMQYPLQPETIKGIMPLFNSMHKTCVEVQCETSSVRHLFLLWKLLEDLANLKSGASSKICK